MSESSIYIPACCYNCVNLVYDEEMHEYVCTIYQQVINRADTFSERSCDKYNYQL